MAQMSLINKLHFPMVCPLGSGKMAVMARLLAAGSFSQTIAEEVGNQKLAAQYICRELRDADEANLVDEEDMHVFGLKPMVEPLHLVCCNACKKTIKASQYSFHAELCRSLGSREENILELDGSTGNRKPPRKERKKSLTAYANQATPVGEQEKLESLDAYDTGASESQLGSQAGIASFAMDTKRYSACVDAASKMDVSGVTPGKIDRSACVMPPPTKRSKLIAAGHPLLSDDLKTASGVTKITSTSGVFPSMDAPKQTKSESERSNSCMIENKKYRQVHQRCLPTKDIPVPLATKMYYSQRYNRHRSALTHLYCEESTKELCSGMVSSKILQGTMVPLQVSSPKDTSAEPMVDMVNSKRQTYTLSSVQSPDQILAQSSEVCLGKSGFLSPSTFSNKFPVDNALTPEAAPVGSMRNKYISKPYSFAGNSGKALGTMQQPNGSVPVT